MIAEMKRSIANLEKEKYPNLELTNLDGWDGVELLEYYHYLTAGNGNMRVECPDL